MSLREKNVTYLNKLGRFIDPHTLEVTNKKGEVSNITSSRFLIAVGGLNFKYRVSLCEKNITYSNKLGRFIDPHTLEVTNKKGDVSNITSSRFLIAVGGRPSALDCEGGDLAISSDDIFSLEKSPGKTLCIGVSYISLECAGFLAGLGYNTTVAVRSILLRGFDCECADMIGSYMEDHGVKFKYSVVP